MDDKTLVELRAAAREAREHEFRELEQAYGRPAAKAIRRLQAMASGPDVTAVKAAQVQERIDRIKNARSSGEDELELAPNRRGRSRRRRLDLEL